MRTAAYCLLFVCVVVHGKIDHASCLAFDADSKVTAHATTGVLRVDELYPSWGRIGGKCRSAFVAGETLHFAARLSGITVASGDRPDLDCTYALVNSLGKIAEGCSGHVLTKEPLFLGGSEAIVYSSIDTAISSHAGQYTLQFTVRDNLTNRSAKKKTQVDLLEKNRFRVLNAGLYCDQDHLYPSNGNVTLGEGIYVGCELRVPKNAKNESIAEVSMMALDRSDKIIEETEPRKMSQGDIDTNGCQFSAASGFIIQKSGFYRIVIRARDLSTNEVDSCELPLLIVDAPVLSTTHKRVDASDSRQRTNASDANRGLSIDAFPTLGRFGGPCDAIFISGERRFFFLVMRGLSPNPERRGDCTMELSIVNSQSSVCSREKQNVKGLLLSHDRSLAAIAFCRGMAEPGPYIARFTVKDNTTKETASKDIAITVVDRDRFALGGLTFCRDENGNVPASPNLAIGDTVYVRCGMYLPKKSTGHDVQMRMSLADSNRREIVGDVTRVIRGVFSAATFQHSNWVPEYSGAFVANRPGSYFVRLEVKDLTTRATVAKEMPFDVFLATGIARSRKVIARGVSRACL